MNNYSVQILPFPLLGNPRKENSTIKMKTKKYIKLIYLATNNQGTNQSQHNNRGTNHSQHNNRGTNWSQNIIEEPTIPSIIIEEPTIHSIIFKEPTIASIIIEEPTDPGIIIETPWEPCHIGCVFCLHVSDYLFSRECGHPDRRQP